MYMREKSWKINFIFVKLVYERLMPARHLSDNGLSSYKGQLHVALPEFDGFIILEGS